MLCRLSYASVRFAPLQSFQPGPKLASFHQGREIFYYTVPTPDCKPFPVASQNRNKAIEPVAGAHGRRGIQGRKIIRPDTSDGKGFCDLRNFWWIGKGSAVVIDALGNGLDGAWRVAFQSVVDEYVGGASRCRRVGGDLDEGGTGGRIGLVEGLIG